MAEGFGWLSTYLLHSTVLIGAAWLLSRFVRFHASTRDFLWRLALVGGVVTASGAFWSAPRPPDFDVLGRAAAADDIASHPGLDGPAPQWKADSREIHVRAMVASPTPECRSALRNGTPTTAGWIDNVDAHCLGTSGVEWYHGLMLLWLAGAAVGLTRLRRGYTAADELRSSLRQAAPRSRALLKEMCGTLDPVILMSSPLLSAPCVLGRRTIGLPDRCERELTTPELRAVLAHELAHVARRDFLWSGVLRVVTSVLWFQPLNRLALHSALEAAELTCDDWALARTGERFGLARSISRVAEWASSMPLTPATVSMAGSDGAGVSARVRRILRGGERSEQGWVRGAVALLLLLPIPALPAVPAPSTQRAAVFVEELDVTSSASDVGETLQGGVRHRLVVARIEDR